MAFDVICTCAIAQRFATAVNRLLFFAFVRFRVSELSVCYWTMWTRTKPAAVLWCSLCGQWSSPAAKISFLPEIELLKAIFEAFEFWNLCRDRERCSSLPEAEYSACSRLVYEQRCFRAQSASLVTICCILGLPVKTPVSYLVVKCVVSCFCAFLLFVQQQNQTRWWLGAAHTHARAQLLFATLSGFASCVLTTLNPVIFLDIVRLPIHVYLARTATAVVATAVSRSFVFCEMWTPSVLISLHSSLTGTGRWNMANVGPKSNVFTGFQI